MSEAGYLDGKGAQDWLTVQEVTGLFSGTSFRVSSLFTLAVGGVWTLWGQLGNHTSQAQQTLLLLNQAQKSQKFLKPDLM